MKSLGFKPFSDVDEALCYAYTTPNTQIISELGVAQACHIYVTTEGVEAIAPVRDAQPANAVEFVGPYHPAVSGGK